MDEVLEKIEAFAARAHAGQKRKYGAEHYIAHPVRVMELCRAYTDRLPLLAAALLHDVLEDTAISKEALRRFLLAEMPQAPAEATLHLVTELTDVYTKAKHPRWNRRQRKAKEARRIAQTSGDSQTIRYADIIDNCHGLARYDPEFAAVFLQECKGLLKHIPNGEPQLYQQAVKTVQDQLQQLKASDTSG